MTARHPWIELISQRFFEVALEAAFRDFVEAFLQREQMSGKEFGRAVGAAGVVVRLRRGDSVRLGTADDTLEYMGEAPLRPLVMRELEAYMGITGTKAYVLGSEAVGDPSYVSRLREGVSPSLGTLDQARRWMGRHSSTVERRAIVAATLQGNWVGAGAGRRRGPLPANPRAWGGHAMTGRRKYMNTREAAAYLRLKRRTLEKYRVTGGGPPFRRFGRHVRYEIHDLDEWADRRFRASTSDKRASGPGSDE